MSGKSISLGLGARNLRDRDFFGVSDPYVVISRPNPSGGFTKIRTSETKMNTLNPNWNDFLFTESELNGYDKDLKLMIQVYDDDGKKGADSKDQLIGSGFFSLKELEAGSIVNTSLPLTDGKRSKSPGSLLVRSYKEHQTGGPQGNPSPSQFQSGPAYPAQPSAGSGGYPRGAGGYPGGGQGGYPGSAPPMGPGGYNQNYPPSYAGGAPPQVGAPGNPAYPQQAYYQPPYGAPPAQGFHQQQYGAPPPPQGYPGQPGPGYPPNPGYQGGDAMFPPSNLPQGPGGFYTN